MGSLYVDHTIVFSKLCDKPTICMGHYKATFTFTNFCFHNFEWRTILSRCQSIHQSTPDSRAIVDTYSHITISLPRRHYDTQSSECLTIIVRFTDDYHNTYSPSSTNLKPLMVSSHVDHTNVFNKSGVGYAWIMMTYSTSNVKLVLARTVLYNRECIARQFCDRHCRSSVRWRVDTTIVCQLDSGHATS